MISMAMAMVIAPVQVRATTPEALDAEFLDYLAACEDEAGNWTVVANEKAPEKPEAGKREPASPAPGKDSASEAVRP
jgi:hypothetical protein